MDAETHNEEGSRERQPPHEALFLVLSYLPLFELLAINGVCRSLRDALDSDILPWLHITVEKKPLGSRVSDDILSEITSKAKGRLRSLVLINCSKITDDGLQAVVANNPLIEKLHVPSCTRLTPEGIIRAVETLNQNSFNLKSIKIYGIYDITKEHLQVLNLLLGPCGEESTLDVEICPKCNGVSLVFECLGKNCNRVSFGGCRGCKFCVARCEDCGRCMDFDEEFEAACMDILCECCWLRLPKCSFCNRPYCSQHSRGNSEFICDACNHPLYIGYSDC